MARNVATHVANSQLRRVMRTHADPHVRIRAAQSLMHSSPSMAADVVLVLSEMLRDAHDPSLAFELIQTIDRARDIMARGARTQVSIGRNIGVRRLLNLPVSQLARYVSNAVGRLTLWQVGAVLVGLSSVITVVTNLFSFVHWLGHLVR